MGIIREEGRVFKYEGLLPITKEEEKEQWEKATAYLDQEIEEMNTRMKENLEDLEQGVGFFAKFHKKKNIENLIDWVEFVIHNRFTLRLLKKTVHRTITKKTKTAMKKMKKGKDINRFVDKNRKQLQKELLNKTGCRF